MLKLNIIDYKYKKKTKIYFFILLIFNKSFFSNNISIFKDLNII